MTFTWIDVQAEWSHCPFHDDEYALVLLSKFLESRFLADDRRSPDREKQSTPLVLDKIPDGLRFPIYALTEQQPPLGIQGLYAITHTRADDHFFVIGWDKFKRIMDDYVAIQKILFSRIPWGLPQVNMSAMMQHEEFLERMSASPREIADHKLAVGYDLDNLFGTYALLTTATVSMRAEDKNECPTLHIGFSSRRDMMQAALDWGPMQGTMNMAALSSILYEFSRMTSRQEQHNFSRTPNESSGKPLKRKTREAINVQDGQEERPAKLPTPDPELTKKEASPDVDMMNVDLDPNKRRIHVHYRGSCPKTGLIDSEIKSGYLDFDETYTTFHGIIESPYPRKNAGGMWITVMGLKTSLVPQKVPKMWETYSVEASARQADILTKAALWRSSFLQNPTTAWEVEDTVMVMD